MMDLQAMIAEVQRELIESWKNQYNWGWFGEEKEANLTFQSYVHQGILSKEGYKEITGEDYDQAETVSSQSQA